MRTATLPRLSTAAAILLGISSCARVPNDSEPDPSSPEVAMPNHVLPEVAGRYKGPLGIYELLLDGTYEVKMDYQYRLGPFRPLTHVTGDDRGRWAGDSRYIYLQLDGTLVQNRYVIKNKGRELYLYPEHFKQGQVLTRIKP